MVLLDLCRIVKPDIKAVFVNTGNEFPEIVQFVKEQKDEGGGIDIIRPAMRVQEVIAKYGFPIPSKETASNIHQVRINPNSYTAHHKLDDNNPYRIAKRWRYLCDEPYDVSDQCCAALKKAPAKKYCKEHNVSMITGVMAQESRLREANYVKQGACNVFRDVVNSQSHPLMIWTEDDIWAYIKQRGLKICELYDKGFKRTGCMFCGFGAWNKDDHRFDLLYNMHPKWYEHCMEYTNKGVTYREALRKELAATGKKLPDE